MARRKQEATAHHDEYAERYASWRRGVVARFKGCAAAGVRTDDAIERHVRASLNQRCLWAQPDDFSVVGPFAVPQADLRRAWYRNPNRGGWPPAGLVEDS